VAASSKAASSEAVEAAYEAMRADDEAFSLPEAPERNAVRLVNLTPRSEAGLQPRCILAYIPGIDGSGFSIISQLPNLMEAEQDIWAVRIPYGNRDNWEDLGRIILALVADAMSSTGAPSVVVLGESMGGAIAMQVAVENSRRTEPVAIEQLVMVNPASSFRRSELSRIWVELSSRVPPTAYKRLVGPLLLPFILDPSSIPLRELPTTGMQRLKKLRFFLSRASDLLPQGAVMHRLSLLNDFRLSAADYASIADGATRTRLLVAENDNLLPVVPDSSRLLRLVPGLERAVLQYGGHAMLQDNRVDLGELLFQKKKSADATGVASTYPDGALHTSSGLRERVLRSKWAAPDRDLLMLPTVTERALLARKFSRTRAFHSPVVVGTERLPHAGRGRPVLFISNHTLLGTIDAVLLMQHVLEHRNVLVRSLAHPLLFRTFNFRRRSEPRDEDESADEEKPRVLRLPGLDGVSASELKRFGIQSINPRALVRELALNHWVLLFPGGAREALKRKSDDLYSLHWPESTEFVRVAAAMGAVIIPVATVGTEDSVNLLLDSEQVSKGVRAITKLRGTQSSGTSDDGRRQPLPVARQWRGATADADGESMLPPLAAPSAPDRVYLRFGSPIEVPVAAEEDRELARGVYADVKAAVREGIASLLVRRESDSYRTLRSRLAFRVKHGDGVEAPACPAWTWETVAGPVDE
jgi:1-acyl-sn-glycerol-3-phosphate acyltransferase/pimeloyl-ACP methyl ester carboxylesterase